MATPPNRKNDVNKSPVGLYVARILIRFEFYDEDKNNVNRHCQAHENEILVKADTQKEAYKKALQFVKLAKSEGYTTDGKNKRKGKWLFEGLTSLVAIYNELDDGAEIAWNKYQNKTVRKVKSWVKQNEDLEVFQKD